MEKKRVPIGDKTFVRYMSAVKGDLSIRLTAEPYISGMYTTLDGRTMGHPHKSYGKWVNGFMDDLRKDGFTVEVVEYKYSDFLPEEDLIKYNVI